MRVSAIERLYIGSIPGQVFLRGPGISDPALDPEPALIKAILGAEASIYCSIFSLTLPEVANALLAAHMGGRLVRIVCDAIEARSKTSQIPALVQGGLDIRAWGADYREMHEKTAIIDGDLVISGSYNWSTLAEKNNVEIMLLLRGVQAGRELVPAMLTQWQNVYDAGTPLTPLTGEHHAPEDRPTP